jgi:hypothetical protein
MMPSSTYQDGFQLQQFGTMGTVTQVRRDGRGHLSVVGWFRPAEWCQSTVFGAPFMLTLTANPLPPPVLTIQVPSVPSSATMMMPSSTYQDGFQLQQFGTMGTVASSPYLDDGFQPPSPSPGQYVQAPPSAARSLVDLFEDFANS